MAEYKSTLAVTMQDEASAVAGRIAASVGRMYDSIERVDELLEENARTLAKWSSAADSMKPNSKEWEEAVRVITDLEAQGRKLAATKLELQSNLPKITGEAGELGRAVDDTGSRFTAFKSILMGIGVGVGLGIFNAIADGLQRIAGIIPGLISQGQQFAETIDQLVDVSGESAEEVSRLAGMFEYLGIPVGTLQTIVPRLTSMVAQNSDKWEALGVSLYDAQGNMKTGIDLLDELRRKLGGVISQGGANVLDDLMGGRQSWAQIADYLKLTDQQVVMLKAHMDELGVTMSGAAVSTAELAQRARNDLDLAIQGVANTIAVTIAPAITAAVSAIADFIRQNAQAIATFVNQVAGFILGLIQGMLGAMGVATSFTQTMADVGATTAQTSDSYADYVAKMAAAERQAPRTGAAGAGAANRQAEAVRKLDAQQQRSFQRELARIDGILQAQLAALDKAEQRQDQTRTREDLVQEVVIAETRVAAGFDPTAADELKKAQQDLADFEAGVVRDAERDRINTVQDTIRKISNAEATAATTQQAIRDIARLQDRAEAKRSEAVKKGDYAEARRQELIIDAAIATRRRLLQKKHNEDLVRSLSAATGAVASAARAQTGFWTRELERLRKKRDEDDKKTKKGSQLTADSVKDDWKLATDLIKGKSTEAASSIYGKPGSLMSVMEEFRVKGIQTGREIAAVIRDVLIPRIKDLAGWLAKIVGFLDKLGGIFGASPTYKKALDEWYDKQTGKWKQGRFGSAEGGLIQPGQLRLVGELGPEIVSVGSTSRVIPNNQLDGGQRMTPVVIPIQIDGREIARVADKHLYWKQQTAPASRRIG